MKLLKKSLLLTISALTLMAPLTGSSQIKTSDTKTTENKKIPQSSKDLTPEQKKEYESYYQKPNIDISNLKYFIEAYPDLTFKQEFDSSKNDWLVTVSVPEWSYDENSYKISYNGKYNEHEFYWCEGRFLPKEELKNKDEYWSLLTYYAEDVRDPKTFTETERNLIRDFGYADNRKNAKTTPVFLFDAIYDTKNQESTESHIVTIPLFGKYTNVHEKMVPHLKLVERKVNDAAKTSPELQAFLGNIKSCDSYAWRPIEGTKIRSLHGLGIAIDFLPKKSRKHLFWGWARDRFPETWMDTEIEIRWILPKEFRDIFEEEGFVWGGRWIIWDNMHFEYRPEQLSYNKDVFWK